MASQKKEQSCAILTIKKPGKMTDKGRKAIAVWLRAHASNLIKHGAGYNDKGDFVARYM